MPDWRIRKRYGRGAARVVLCPEPYRVTGCEPSLLEAWSEIAPQLLAGSKSAMTFGVLIIAALLLTLMRDRSDQSLTQLALWRDPVPAVVAKPPLAVTPPAVPIPKMLEPIVAKTKARPVPKPVDAVRQEPTPEPVVAINRKPLQTPVPKARRPKIEMAALNRPSLPVPRRQTQTRVEPDRLAGRTQRQAIDPVVSALVLAQPTQPRSSRTRPVANHAASRSRVIPAFAAAPGRATPTENRTGYRSKPEFRVVQGNAGSRLGIAPATSPRIAPEPDRQTTVRNSRVVTATSSPRRRATVEVGQAPAALSPAGPGSLSQMPRASQRFARETTASEPRQASQQKTSLRGVSLASLSSCMSDREEDLLKQRVLAAVRNRDDCVSSSGSYRFVETKNLNAFSMWIERAPGRRSSDRCVELSHALACLE